MAARTFFLLIPYTSRRPFPAWASKQLFPLYMEHEKGLEERKSRASFAKSFAATIFAKHHVVPREPLETPTLPGHLFF